MWDSMINRWSKMAEAQPSKYGSSTSQECSVCDKLGTSRCSKCKTPYCSQKCQKKDWPEHKHKCDTVPNEAVPFGGFTVNKVDKLPLEKAPERYQWEDQGDQRANEDQSGHKIGKKLGKDEKSYGKEYSGHGEVIEKNKKTLRVIQKGMKSQKNHEMYEAYIQFQNDLENEESFGVQCSDPAEDEPYQSQYDTLRREHNSVDKTICKNCNQHERGSLFLPCTHVVACKECAENIEVCVVCQKKITKKISVILS